MVLLVICYYAYQQGYITLDVDKRLTTISDIHAKLTYSSVSTLELLEISTEIALKRCNDTGFQEFVGHTPVSCIKKLHQFKPLCAERIFGFE